MQAVEAFLRRNSVFTLSELRTALGDSRSEKTLRNLLAYHERKGQLVRVDGVYCVVPPALWGKSFVPDRFLVAAKLRPDAVLAYHTAFELLGFANQVFTTTYYTSVRYRRPFVHQGVRYVCVRLPERLRRTPFLGVVRAERSGVQIMVTSRERTLVDCLDHPRYAGGFEEACRCIATLPFVDEDALWNYLTVRDKAVLFAKVGWVLEQMQGQLFVSDSLLAKLQERAPRHPVMVTRGERGTTHFVARWNLVVPSAWMEVLKKTIGV